MKPYQAYSLSLAVSGLAFVAWGQGVGWHLIHLSTYRIFPLFGLIAFSLFWSMYMISLARRLTKTKVSFGDYYRRVGFVALAAILLHPGLLVWQLWRDGFGLPPESYLQHYVAPSLRWAALLGTTAWLIFLAYELRHKYRGRSWWRFMEYAADLAMVAIFIHSLTLGSNLQHGWFAYVWYFYGLSLAVALIDLYWRKFGKKLPAAGP